MVNKPTVSSAVSVSAVKAVVTSVVDHLPVVSPVLINDEYRSPTGFKYLQPDGISIYKQP